MPRKPTKDLRVGEVATECQVEPKTVRRWIRTGHLQAYRLPNRSIRIEPAKLKEFKEKHQVKK